MTPLRIIFMGTPEFAVTILRTLVDAQQFEIVGVVTAPDKPAGRGRKIKMSDVKAYSILYNLNVLQPTNLKDEEFTTELKKLNASLFVVVAFRMLPEVVWSIPPFGTINLHASLLPQYRGAAPINWAIMNGEPRTGVTTFFIEKEIDTGEIIEQRSLGIGSDETLGELYERLMALGAETTLSTVLAIRDGKVIRKSQVSALHEEVLKKAPKIFKEDCQIDFNKSVLEAHNFCRGLDPYPGAWCQFHDNGAGELQTFKLFSSRVTDIPVGETRELDKNKLGILIPCNDFHLLILEIQPDGKRKMTSNEYLAGHNISDFTTVH